MSGARRVVMRPNQEIRIPILYPKPMTYLLKDSSGNSTYQPSSNRTNWIDCADLTPLTPAGE